MLGVFDFAMIVLTSGCERVALPGNLADIQRRQKVDDVPTPLVGRDPSAVLSHQHDGHLAKRSEAKAAHLIRLHSVTQYVRLHDYDPERDASLANNRAVELHDHPPPV